MAVSSARAILSISPNNDNVFFFDAGAAGKMRRAAFVPLLLILPIAAMFGADPSKSQPMHFLMSFGMGVVCGGIIVLMSWTAINRRIAHLSGLRLSLVPGKIVWTSAIGESTVDLDRIRDVRIRQRRGNARTIVLTLEDGSRARIEGFLGMNELCEALTGRLPPGSSVRRSWMPV